MSLYEALDRFVGAGVLACAGLVGVEMPAGVALDGAAFSRRLRSDHTLAEPFGAALDALAHAIYFARDRHGIGQDVAERHAATLAPMLGTVRFSAADLAGAVEQARQALQGGGLPAGALLAEAWLGAARQLRADEMAGLNEAVARFLLVEMLGLVVDRPRLLVSLKPALIEHRDALPSATASPAGDRAAPTQSVEVADSPPLPEGQEPPSAAAASDPARAAVPALTSDAAAPARTRAPLPAIRRFQAILAQQSLSAEHRSARLEELSSWLTATVAQLTRPANDGAEIRRHKLAAAAALEAGDLERAMEHLRCVRDEVREGRRRAEARIADELENLRRQMVEEAMATARLGELALARMDLDAAAAHFADAAGNLPAREQALELEYRQRQADALAMKAETTGATLDLEAAAQAFRHCRRLIGAGGDQRLRARIDVGLGDMLLALGERQADAGPALEEAVAVFAEAVASVDRAAKPMQWALVQLSHAAALIALGERRADRDRLWKQAAAALMPALEVFESRGAADLADAARGKLRLLAAGLGASDPQRLLA